MKNITSVNIFGVCFFIIAVFFSLLGCDQNVKTDVFKAYPGTNSLVEEINAPIEEKLVIYIENETAGNVKNLKIVSSNVINHGMLLFVLFEHDNDSYEGLFQIVQEKSTDIAEVVQGDYTKIDKSAAFTVHQMTGNAARNGEEKHTYMFVGGVVHDKKISAVNIKFSDGLLSNVKVEENGTYNYAKIDITSSVESINAIDTNGDTVYNYPPYPPQKKLIKHY